MNADLLRVASVRDGVRIKELPQGTVVLAFHTSQAFEVNGTGAEILKHIGQPVLLRDLVTRLASKYGTDGQDILPQVLGFLEECLRLDLVCLGKEPISGSPGLDTA